MNLVEKLARDNSLECAPEKSEVIRVHDARYRSPGEIKIKLGDHEVAETDKLRILGMIVQSNGRANFTIAKIKKSTLQIAKIVRRITKKRAGLKEEETLRIMQALVVSRVAYSLPFHSLNRQEKEQANIILRTAYKAALGLPNYTANEKLMNLGVSNTFEEICEATLVSQKERLQKTRTGRAILQRVGSRLDVQSIIDKEDLSNAAREKLKALPIPRNMDPHLHEDRRKARVNFLRRKLEKNPNVVYTDAAFYDKTNASLVIVDQEGVIRDCLTLTNTSTEEAETGALLLAVRYGEFQGKSLQIITDSKKAVQNIINGRIHKRLTKILPLNITKFQNIIWTPGHEELEGNERADQAARELTNRSASSPSLLTPLPNTFGERLNIQRKARALFPPPDKSLTAAEHQSLRQIQTNTYPNILRLSKMFPEKFSNACNKCGEISTLFHASWGCRTIWPSVNTNTKLYELWEAALASSDPGVQKYLIFRAKTGAEETGALEGGNLP